MMNIVTEDMRTSTQAGGQAKPQPQRRTDWQADRHTLSNPKTSNYQNQQPTQTAFCGNDILSPSLPSPFPSPNCKVADWGPLWGKQLLRNLGKGRGRGGGARRPPQEAHYLPPTPRALFPEALNLGLAKGNTLRWTSCIASWLLGLVA